eukprot:425847_1
MITSNDSLNKLHELDENYFISLQFRILQKNIVRCHLFYGTNTNCRMRFYPEHLTTIIPKFFLKNCDVNYYQNMQKLFDAKYKHGFATDLNDAVFNKYYKIITKAEHVSVNYNRNVIKQNITLGYEYKDVLYHKITQLNRQCKPGKELEIEECPFIAHIVESLVLFCKIEYNVPSNADKFDIHYLSKCYNHIINTHLFCLRKDQRKLIQKYICSQVSCPLGRNCMVLKNHSLREREVFISKQQQSVSDRSVILMDILRTCLNSLHCYLLHEGGKLYRLEKDTNCAGRFATDSNPLQFTDEIDSLTQFLIEITCTRHMRSISFFMQWLLQEEYDWSSILLDINCRDPDQSNIYLILKQYGISHLFHIIHNKYINSVSSEDKHLKDNVDAINFGISVIHWLEYGDLPNHKSFITEILHNKYSTVNQQLLEKYKNECLIKIETSETLYRYTLNEMLSLKLYTDTTKFTSLFRKAHWTNQNMMQMKKEFYWWAITLYKTSKYHARPLPPFDSKNPKPSKLFHGINTILAVNERLPKYHGPVSTTLVDTVAHQFSDGSGLLWSISTTYYNPFRFIKGISVSWISCHKNESEMLLMDEYLHITTTLNFANNQKKIQHLCSKLMIYKEKIIDKNMFWQQMGFKLNNELLTVIQTHPLLLQITQYQDNTETQTVLQRLVGELSVVALKPLLHAFKNIVLKNIFIRNDTIVCIPSKVLFGELILITDHKEIANPIDKIEQHELNSDVAVYGSFVEYDGPLQIIVPYNTNIVSVGLYLRSSIQLSFILIKTFKINHQIQEDTLYNRISYLFGALKIYEKPLKYGDNFCKAVDIKYIETHKDQSINVIKNHPMLLEYSNFQQRTMLPILLKILNFQTLKNEFSDRLCLSLIYRKLQIKDPNAFWKSQGCQKQDIQDEYILSNIKKHPLLLKPTQYLQRTLLQRLVEELEIDEMRETYDFFESITDTRNVNVNLYIKDDKIICMEIHKIYKSNIKYIVVTHTENDNITYQIDSKHTENVYIYQNIDIRAEFVVPFAVDLHSVSVYAQISAEFNYILLKTFDIKQKIKQDTPSNRVDYLLNVLRRYTTKITHHDGFYKALQIQYNNDWIPIIKNNQLFVAFWKHNVNSSETIMVQRLVQELKMSEFSKHCKLLCCKANVKSDTQIDFHPIKINIHDDATNDKDFTNTQYFLINVDQKKEIIFKYKESMNILSGSYQIYVVNVHLFGHERILLQTFSREYTATFIDGLHLWDGTSIKSSKSRYKGISRYSFYVTGEEEKTIHQDFHSKVFTDVEQFNISLQKMQFNTTHKLYVQQTFDDTFKPILIKSFHQPLRQYTLLDGSNFELNDGIKVNNSTNTIQIFCKSSIYINETINVINNSAEYYQDNSKEKPSKSQSKGLIHLVSLKDIVINGNLNVNGTILLDAANNIINNGKINNDKIIISCKSFLNNPQNKIIPNKETTAETIYANQITPRFEWQLQRTREEKISLSVCADNYEKWRKRLTYCLDYGTKKRFTHCSWIAFKMHKPAMITNIRITNTNDRSAISDISLYVTSSSMMTRIRSVHGTDWYRLMENLKIQNKTEIQQFSITSSLFYEYSLRNNICRKTDFDVIIIEINDNHGSQQENSFGSFEIFGRCICSEM